MINTRKIRENQITLSRYAYNLYMCDVIKKERIYLITLIISSLRQFIRINSAETKVGLIPRPKIVRRVIRLRGVTCCGARTTSCFSLFLSRQISFSPFVFRRSLVDGLSLPLSLSIYPSHSTPLGGVTSHPPPPPATSYARRRRIAVFWWYTTSSGSGRARTKSVGLAQYHGTVDTR